jgi:hypothetical protein
MNENPRITIEIKVRDDRPDKPEVTLSADMRVSDLEAGRAEIVERLLSTINLGLHNVFHEKILEAKIVK